jgi:hypothetical protein
MAQDPGEKNKIVEDSYGPGVKNPKLKKGVYHAIGAAYNDEGKVPNRGGTSPNVKTGYPEDGR